MIRGDEPFRRVNGTSASLELKWKRQAGGSGIRTRGSAASALLLLCACFVPSGSLTVKLEFDWLSGQLEEYFGSCVCPELIPVIYKMLCLPLFPTLQDFKIFMCPPKLRLRSPRHVCDHVKEQSFYCTLPGQLK